LPYLAEDPVKALLHALTHHFPGGQLVFDAMPSLVIIKKWFQCRRYRRILQVGLDDHQDIKQLEPQLDLVKEFRMSERVEFSRFPFAVRALYRAMEASSALRRIDHLLVYRF